MVVGAGASWPARTLRSMPTSASRGPSSKRIRLPSRARQGRPSHSESVVSSTALHRPQGHPGRGWRAALQQSLRPSLPRAARSSSGPPSASGPSWPFDRWRRWRPPHPLGAGGWRSLLHDPKSTRYGPPARRSARGVRRGCHTGKSPCSPRRRPGVRASGRRWCAPPRG